MKTSEELATLKEEVEALNAKLAGLSEEELKAVAGGDGIETFECPNCHAICYYLTGFPKHCSVCGTYYGLPDYLNK